MKLCIKKMPGWMPNETNESECAYLFDSKFNIMSSVISSSPEGFTADMIKFKTKSMIVQRLVSRVKTRDD